MSATRQPVKKDEKKKSLTELLSGQAANGHEGGHGAVADAIGALGAGLGKMFGNLLPAAFKSAKIKDTATQILTSPLGGKILGTYTTEVEIVGAPEVILAIEQAKEETERAAIEAEAEVEKAKGEAGGHHGEEK